MAKLEKYLTRKRLTAKQFSKIVGCSVITVHRILSGNRRPSSDLMVEIYKITGGYVTPNDFLVADIPKPLGDVKKVSN